MGAKSRPGMGVLQVAQHETHFRRLKTPLRTLAVDRSYLQQAQSTDEFLDIAATTNRINHLWSGSLYHQTCHLASVS